MKIVISGYVGKKITGIGRNLISLLNEAKTEDQYVIFVNKDMVKDFKFTNPNVQVKTYNVSKMSSMKNLLWTTFIFPLKAIFEHADRSLIPNFTLLLFKFRPTYVIMHDLIEYNVPNKFSRLRMFYRTRLANPITAKRADRIITISENSKKDIMHFLHVPKNRIVIVRCGVDQNKFHKMDDAMAEEILKKKNWPLNFILYAGTVDHPGKNSFAVIRAFEELKKSNRYDGELILAGMPGSGYEYVKEYAEKSDYKEQITFAGFVTDEELIALYSKCATFAFVSLYEGFGIPPLEALACGAKVVTSNTSSLPEVVGDLGISVDPRDQEAITEAIFDSLKKIPDEEYREKIVQHLKKYELSELGMQFAKALK